MLNEDEINALSDIFEDRFDEVNRLILEDIGRTLRHIEELTPSQAKQLQQMYTYGADLDEMTRRLAQVSGRSIEDIKALYSEVAKEGYDWSKPFYDARGIKQLPFKDNKELQRLILSIYKVTGESLSDISLTTVVGVNTAGGFKSLGSFYKDTVDKAITAVATGTKDYNSVIRQAVKDLGGSGLRVKYESGYTKRIDSAVRQNVLDGISYIAQEAAKSNGEAFGADGYEISAHATCAPDHLPYQGKQYSKEQFEKLQARLKRPIGQWNCRHIYYPIILGVSTPAYSEEELREFEQNSNEEINIDGKDYTRYECSQIQRKLETKLRYARDEKALYKAVGDDDLTNSATERIRILSNKYAEVSNKAGLPMRAERTRNVKAKLRNKVANDYQSGIIDLKGMSRKAKDNYIEPMPKKQLNKIIKNFRKNGGSIQMDEATDAYLRKKNAEAITYDAKTILLKKNPGRAAVFEELIHATQYRNGENDGSYLSRLKCEISAQKKLLKNKVAYKLTPAEIKQTEKALESYERELKELLKE